ncbi:MAG: T9SS type A sorting domain-containing protein [Flavobacteriaceae bacterium]|nr:T9SS type A sorting domain-containing protein [Flavobacteriaceae bacterium]
MQSDYEVNGQDATYEPHYDIITSEDQVQIYEQVLGDVNGNVTTVLERAHHHLKDNRLVPKGFTSTHFTYDTTEVAGLALGDLNFNIEEGEEGSGTDDITYMVPLNGYEGEVNVVVKLWYQSSPPKWNEEMFSYSTPQIDLFKELYLAQGAAPVLIKEASATATAVGVEENLATKWDVYPNPLIGNTLWLSRDNTKGVASVMLYDMNGRLVSEQFMRGERGKVLVMGVGAYVLVVKEGGDTQIFKVLRIE